MKKETPKTKNVANAKEHSALIQQISAFMLLILVFLSIYLYLRDFSKSGIIHNDISTQFSSEYCNLLRPPEWSGGQEGNTFIFKHPKDDFIIALSNFASSTFFFSAVNKNPEHLSRIIKNLAEEMNIKLEDLKILFVHESTFKFRMPSLHIYMKTKKYKGRAVIFYSHNVRFLYLALWGRKSKRNRYVARVFMDYVTLKPPLGIPVYKRPVIDTDDNIDSVRLIKEADVKIEEAVSLWHNAKEAPDNVLHAMKAFQTAMKLIAKSGMGGALEEKHEKIIKIYEKCRKYRKLRLNKMKSGILQAEHLGNKRLAKEIAQELMEMASLDSEAEIRSWAEKQCNINQLNQ